MTATAKTRERKEDRRRYTHRHREGEVARMAYKKGRRL